MHKKIWVIWECRTIHGLWRTKRLSAYAYALEGVVVLKLDDFSIKVCVVTRKEKVKKKKKHENSYKKKRHHV